MSLALVRVAHGSPGLEVYGYLDELERALSQVEEELEEIRERGRADLWMKDIRFSRGAGLSLPAPRIHS